MPRSSRIRAASRTEADGVTSAEGDSLRELRLYGRLFKNRCSYMIYSAAFDALPDPLRQRILVRLWDILGSDDEEDFGHLGGSEKDRIRAIVSDTVERLPACWKGAS